MKQRPADFDVFLGKSVVAMGWSRIDFSKLPDENAVADAVRELCKRNNWINNANQLGKALAEVKRFKGIKSGDRILVPYHDSVCLATGTGKEQYDKNDGKNLDLANQKSVTYVMAADGKPLPILRSRLSKGFM